MSDSCDGGESLVQCPECGAYSDAYAWFERDGCEHCGYEGEPEDV